MRLIWIQSQLDAQTIISMSQTKNETQTRGEPRNYANDRKSYLLVNHFKSGYWLDVRQDTNDWRMAKILRVAKEGGKFFIETRMDGWSNKYTEKIKLPSDRLAPLHRYSNPYTGPIKRADRDQLVLTTDHLLAHRDRLEKFARLDQPIDCEMITQYLRGDLYVFIDTILSQPVRLREKEYRDVMAFLQNYVRLGAEIIRNGLAFLQDIGEYLKDLSFYTVHPKLAYLLASIELLDSFANLIRPNSSAPRLRFHLAHLQIDKEDQAIKKLRAFMVEANLPQLSSQMLQLKVGDRNLPWCLRKGGLQLLHLLGNQVELPQFDLRDAQDIYELFVFFSDFYPSEVIEARQIGFTFQLIFSTGFERKLKGLNELKNLIDRTAIRAKAERLVGTMKQKGLADYLTDNNNFNSELFRRSTPVFEFLVRQRAFTQQHLDRIVSLSKSRHESDLRLIYSTIATLGKQLSAADLDHLFGRLIGLEIDELLLGLLREFTINAMANLNAAYDYYSKRKIAVSEKYGLFGLPVLWAWLQDQSPLSAELTLTSVSEFVQLLTSEHCRQERDKYIGLCLKQIEKGTNFAQSLRTIQMIVKECPMGTITEKLVRADREINIIDTCTNTLTKILSRELPQGKLPLEQCVQCYFSFLQEVNPILRRSLNAAHVKQFWRLPNLQPLLCFLKKTKEESSEQKGASRFYQKRLDNLLIRQLIEGIFMNPQLMNNYRNMDYNVYSTIDELFLTYHIRIRNIDYNHRNTIRIAKTETVDPALYFRIILAENSQKILDAAIKRLVDLNIRPMTSTKFATDIANKVTMWASFVEKIFRELGRNYTMLLRVLRHFLEAIEGRMKSINILSTVLTNIVVKIADTDRIKTISLPCCSSVYKLRQKIGEQFDMKNTDFDIYLKENNLTTSFTHQQDYSLALININSEHPNSPSVIIRPSKEIHPHVRAVQKFNDAFAQGRLQTLYDLLDQLTLPELSLAFEILGKVSKLKNLERKILKLELDEGGWDSLLSSTSMRRLRYQLSILQANKNSKWVFEFIKNKGVEHMISILVRVDPTTLGTPFNVKCCSILIQLLSEYIRFMSGTSVSTLEQIFHEIVALLTSAIQYAGQQTPEFVTNGFRLLNSIIGLNSGMMTMFYRHKNTKIILQYALFMNRKDFAPLYLDGIKKEIENINSRQLLLEALIVGFLNADFLDNRRQVCDSYFAILSRVLEGCPKSDWSGPNGLFFRLRAFISQARKLTYLQKSPTDYDGLLNGWLTLTTLINRKTGLSVQEIVDEKQALLAEWLLHQCLFPPRDGSQSAKCKSARNRAEAFAVLSLLPLSKDYCMKETEKLLKPILAKSAWRKPGEWSIAVSAETPREFRGLKNMAATCYINSLMQQLYLLREFREQLLKVPISEETENVLFEVQKIFAFLKCSQGASYTPKSFCSAFKVDGQPIDPRMQMDADEFFNMLMDKLEGVLKRTNAHNIITNVFQGELCNQIICEGCPHFSERSEEFLSLGVSVKNKPSLELALKEFVKGEVLDGDNAYYCEKCEKKVRCMKRACVKELPNVLMIVLKRFEFDYDIMQKIKINDYCEFPLKLDMRPYMKEFLGGVAAGQTQSTIRPDSYYQYTLKGTVIHHGTSEAGHYYSYCKIGPDTWYEFNDEWIDKFDLADLKDQAFGGAEESQLIEGEKKAKNAYLLFYQRDANYIGGEPTPYMVTPLDKVPQGTMSQFNPAMSSTQSSFSQLSNSQQIARAGRALEIVQEDNLRNEYIRVAFDPNLIKFILCNAGVGEGRLVLLFNHLVVLRSKASYLGDYHNLIERLFARDPNSAEWYINQIGEPFLREFLFDAPREIKYAVLGIIQMALRYSKPNPDFVKRCMSCLAKRGMTPFARIFHIIGSTSKEYLKILHELEYPQKVLRILRESQPLQKPSLPQFSSQFGDIALWDEHSKQEVIEFSALLQSLEFYNIKFQDIKDICVKRNRTIRSSICKIITRAVRQKEVFERVFVPLLTTQILTYEDERTLLLYLRVMKQLSEVKDEYSEERIRRLAQIHVNALRETVTTYQYFNLLFESLLRICSKNLAYRQRVISSLSENKSQLFKQFKSWLSDSGNPVLMVNSGRWYYWRKPLVSSQLTAIQAILVNLQAADAYLRKRQEDRLDKFNKLVTKEPYNMDEALEDTDLQKGSKFEYIASTGRYINFEVVERMGLLYQLRMDGGVRWATVDEEIN